MSDRADLTPNERTVKKRAQRKRQAEGRQRQLAQRTGERDRARRDRRNLADAIELLPGVSVNREHSGRWCLSLDGSPARSLAEMVAEDGFDGVLDVLRVIWRRDGFDPSPAEEADALAVLDALTDQRFAVVVERLSYAEIGAGERVQHRPLPEVPGG